MAGAWRTDAVTHAMADYELSAVGSGRRWALESQPWLLDSLAGDGPPWPSACFLQGWYPEDSMELAAVLAQDARNIWRFCGIWRDAFCINEAFAGPATCEKPILLWVDHALVGAWHVWVRTRPTNVWAWEHGMAC